MLDLQDYQIIQISGHSRKVYRAYCDQCGADRGYLMKNDKNDHKLCKSCSRRIIVTTEMIEQYPNVDFNDYIDRVQTDGKTQRYFRCRCPQCNKDRGYFKKSRWRTLCISCTVQARSLTLESKIKISCTKQNILRSDFMDFITPRNKRERMEFDDTGLRIQCLQKADFRCCKCGNRGGAMNAHHMCSWRDYPELRFDLNNLACLCVICHHEFHMLYGYKNNTKEQYETWLCK